MQEDYRFACAMNVVGDAVVVDEYVFTDDG